MRAMQKRLGEKKAHVWKVIVTLPLLRFLYEPQKIPPSQTGWLIGVPIMDSNIPPETR